MAQFDQDLEDDEQAQNQDQPAQASTSPGSVSQSVQDVIGQQFKDALAQRDAKNQNINIAQAFAGLTNKDNVNNDYFGSLRKQNNPVGDINDQQSAVQQAIANKMSGGKLDAATAAQDPNSPQSQVFRTILANLAKKSGMDEGIITDNLSKSDLADLGSNPLDMSAKLQENADNKKLQYDTLWATKELQLKSNELAHEDRLDETHNKGFDKALTDTQGAMEQMRGNPAMQQAEKDLYSAQKAKSLINMYGDPGKLSPPQVQLVATEVAKIASGGVPSVEELKGLNPSTFPKALAEAATKVTGKPSSAHAAAFIKQFSDYLNALEGDAHSVITDRYERVLNSRQRTLRPEDYQTLNNNYLGRFKESAAPAASSSSVEDLQAIEWAKANPNDPRAAKILKLHGVQ